MGFTVNDRGVTLDSYRTLNFGTLSTEEREGVHT